MKQDYICTYAYDDCIINVLVKADSQSDASDGFRMFINEELFGGAGFYAQIRVRPLELIQVIEV